MIENFGHALGGMAQDRGRARLQALVDRRHGIKSPDELLEEWKAAYAQLEAQNKVNFHNAVVNKAMCAGYAVQIKELADALRSVAPNHPVFAQSGLKFADGKPKSKLRVMFEAAFDEKLRAVGGIFSSNPRAYRKDTENPI